MMMITSQASARRSQTSTISAAATISLSATGSRNAPKAEVWPQRRARYPSAQSVIAASAKMLIASQFLALSDRSESGR